MKSHCIDIDTLDAYIHGHLPDKKRDRAEKHLSICDECMEEFVLANILLSDSESDSYEPGPADAARAAFQKIKEKVKHNFSEWVAGMSLPQWLTDGTSPIRFQNRLAPVLRSPSTASPTDSIFIRKDMNGLQTEMYVEKADHENARLWMKVLRDNETAENISLTLLKDGKIPFARFLKDGYVLFEKQPFGDYTLMLEGKAAKSKKWFQTDPYHFEINEAGFYEK